MANEEGSEDEDWGWCGGGWGGVSNCRCGRDSHGDSTQQLPVSWEEERLLPAHLSSCALTCSKHRSWECCACHLCAVRNEPWTQGPLESLYLVSSLERLGIRQYLSAAATKCPRAFHRAHFPSLPSGSASPLLLLTSRHGKYPQPGPLTLLCALSVTWTHPRVPCLSLIHCISTTCVSNTQDTHPQQPCLRCPLTSFCREWPQAQLGF